MSINGIVCYAPDPCECPDCTIAGLRAALQRIARGDYCADTCTAYLTAMAALGCPHTPPCPGCTGVVAEASPPWFDTCQTLDCEAWPTWRVVDAAGRVVRGSYNCDEHAAAGRRLRPGERYEHRQPLRPREG